MFGISQLAFRLIALVADASLRSLALVLAALVAIAVVRARSAAARHAIWAAVVGGMLALPVLEPLLLSVPLRVTARPWFPAASLHASGVPASPRRPAAATSTRDPLPAPAAARWPLTLAAIYLAGVLGLLARFVAGYRGARRLVRNCESVREARALYLLEDLAAAQSAPWPLPQLLASNAVAVPMTVGRRQPVILLPGGWQGWDDWKLRAVVAHELAHIRRGDWLTAVAASLNRCLFWFHPLAWWLERRLGALAEQASDDAALSSTGDAPRYASVILEFAESLRARGRRLALDSVAMARTPNVSRRITRILELSRPGSGVLHRSGWTSILLCALPLVYSAAALQVNQTAPERAANPGIAQLLTDGSKLSPAEAQQLEQQLLRYPDDIAARGKLISYYEANRISGPPAVHTFWLIDHHPESPVTLYYSTRLIGDDPDRAETLWRQQAAAHSDNATVLANAAKFFERRDQFAEEDLLKRARQIEPSNPVLTGSLADLYVRAIMLSLLPGFPNGMVTTEPSFAAAAKQELENSSDAALVGLVGEFLTVNVRARTSGAQAQAEYAELLLKRAQSLEPGNPQWTAALARLAVERDNAAAFATPPNGIQRIRVGGEVQQSNRIHAVTPVYPPLAKQARIQGVVRFNVIIARDGHVSSVQLIAGHPLLVPAAQEAVQQWIYQPTLLNGDPVEVATVVDVNFTLLP